MKYLHVGYPELQLNESDASNEKLYKVRHNPFMKDMFHQRILASVKVW